MGEGGREEGGRWREGRREGDGEREGGREREGGKEGGRGREREEGGREMEREGGKEREERVLVRVSPCIYVCRKISVCSSKVSCYFFICLLYLTCLCVSLSPYMLFVLVIQQCLSVRLPAVIHVLFCLSVCLSPHAGKARELQVTQLFPEEGNLGLVLPTSLCKWTTEMVRKEGVTVLPGTTVSGVALAEDGKVTAALSNGSEVRGCSHV